MPLVLCYHGVSDSWPSGLSVGPGELERQVGLLLRRGYRPASAEQALEGRAKLLHVTFDDAYRSVASVLPALERLGVPVTVFACPAYADAGTAIDVPELAGEATAYPNEVLTMDWEALREAADRGVEVASHTVTHPHLTELSDRELDCELGESRERLEAELSRPCRFLSYPYGEHDPRVRAAAARAGYAGAFALSGTRSFTDRYAIPRVGIYRPDRGTRFALKTLLAGRLALRRPPRRFDPAAPPRAY